MLFFIYAIIGMQVYFSHEALFGRVYLTRQYSGFVDDITVDVPCNYYFCVTITSPNFSNNFLARSVVMYLSYNYEPTKNNKNYDPTKK